MPGQGSNGNKPNAGKPMDPLGQGNGNNGKKPEDPGPPKAPGQPPLKHDRATRPKKDQGKPSPFLPNGTKVECPNKHRIGVITGQVLNYGYTAIEALNYQRGQDRVQGEPMFCKICGEPWGSIDRVGVNLHTKDGWITSSGIRFDYRKK